MRRNGILGSAAAHRRVGEASRLHAPQAVAPPELALPRRDHGTALHLTLSEELSTKRPESQVIEGVDDVAVALDGALHGHCASHIVTFSGDPWHPDGMSL